MSLKDRINELFKEFPEKKPAHLARFANISRSAVSDWMNGNTQTISGRNAFVVARFFPNVSPEWVQTGKGKKYISRAEGLGIGREVPLISWMQAGACCGANGDYASNAESWWTCPVPHGRNTYALRVHGDSMTNPYPGPCSYPEGSIIFVDPDVAVISGRRVIAKQPSYHEVIFREYRIDGGKHYLKPTNPQYPATEISLETRFCGVVIGQWVSEELPWPNNSKPSKLGVI